jgi:hypothetical protein
MTYNPGAPSQITLHAGSKSNAQYCRHPRVVRFIGEHTEPSLSHDQELALDPDVRVALVEAILGGEGSE